MPRARYPFTADENANRLLAQNGTALLIGLCLEQQVRSEKAMFGPYALQERLGHLDARRIAAMPLPKLDRVFREKPAIHRFPGMMAKRVRELCGRIAQDYGNDGARVWARAASGQAVYERLLQLPGFGAGKAASAVRILATFGGRELEGWKRFGSDEDLPWVYERGKRVEGS
jgi:uncharacterized HhH-GPD family protein